jgi:RES domain-containing protein
VTVRAWRIVQSRFAAAAFSGEGARQAGGRWNSPATAMVYTAGDESLAILEMLVHLHDRDQLRRYELFEVRFDLALVTTTDPTTLPRTWRRSPPGRPTQRVGDRWIAAGTSAVLRVPSVLVASEWNYLLNPAHNDFPKIAIGPARPVRLDPRLIPSAER